MPQRPDIPAETHLAQVSLEYLFLPSQRGPAVNHHLTGVKSITCRLPEWWEQQASIIVGHTSEQPHPDRYNTPWKQ